MRNPNFDDFWDLFSGSLDRVDKFVVFEHEGSLPRFLEDVRDAFQITENTVFPSDLDLDPVNDENEIVIGPVTMPVLKALFMLKIRLNKTLDEVMQERVSLSAKASPEELKGVFKEYDSLREQVDFVDHLFWLGVEKQLPVVAEGNNFALRHGWNIVRIPEDVGADLYTLMTLEVLRCSVEQS
jgi:hypothetical protein